MAKKESAKQKELRLLQQRLQKATSKEGVRLKENLPHFENKTAKELHDIRGTKLQRYLVTTVKELGYEELPVEEQSSNPFSSIDAVERMLISDVHDNRELRSKQTGELSFFSSVNEALVSILYDSVNTYSDKSLEMHLQNYQSTLSSLINELNEAPYTEKYLKCLDDIAKILNFNESLSFSQKQILTDTQERMGF